MYWQLSILKFEPGWAYVHGFIDGSNRTACCSGHSDGRRWQVASCNTALGQRELHRNNAAPHAEDTRPIGIDRLLNLRAECDFALACAASVEDGLDF